MASAILRSTIWSRMSTSSALDAGQLILALPDHQPTPAERFRSTEQLFVNTKQNDSTVAIYPANAAAYLGPIATEDLAMFTRRTNDRFASRVLAALAIVATMAIASLSYAVANIQVVA